MVLQVFRDNELLPAHEFDTFNAREHLQVRQGTLSYQLILLLLDNCHPPFQPYLNNCRDHKDSDQCESINSNLEEQKVLYSDQSCRCSEEGCAAVEETGNCYYLARHDSELLGSTSFAVHSEGRRKICHFLK